MNMIEAVNVSKNYGVIEAVKDVSFMASHAEILGLLGPNGAGKTTIMKILTGYHFPSSGQVRIAGFSVEEEPEEIKKRIGYLPEGNPLYGDLSPEEYLSFIASVRLIPKRERQKAVDAAITACGLKGYSGRRIDSLSKGYRQRTALAQAIIHDPDILILDEPTSGLDPNQIIEIRSLIRELGKSKTVILSTHIMQEVEALCTRVLILNEGRIAAQGTAAEIAGKVKGDGGDTWELFLKGARAEELSINLSSLGKIRAISEISALAMDNGITKLEFTLEAGNDEDEGAAFAVNGELIFDWALDHGYKIIGMTRKSLKLEDIFAKLTNEPSDGMENGRT